MLLALAATTLVVIALLGEVAAPQVRAAASRWRARRRRLEALPDLDPGRERRAEVRARELLRSCVNDEEWGMYRDLGFIRVWGTQPDRPGDHDGPAGAPYAYLIYPHKPIVAFLPQTGRLLGEYCVTFLERIGDRAELLPDSDDVLAKWMALTADERRLIESANLHLPGHQLNPRRVKRDLWRLRQWERKRAGVLAAGRDDAADRARSRR